MGIQRSVSLRVGEAARILGVHPDTLRRWERNGVISSFRVSPRGQRRYSWADVAALRDAMSGPGGRVVIVESQLSPLEDPLTQVSTRMLFYTLCKVCGALTDWSDTRQQADRKAHQHRKDHADSASLTLWVQ